MSDNDTVENKSQSHKMTDWERRQAIEEALQRRKPVFRLTEGQVRHIGRAERQVRESRTQARER